MMQTKDAKVGMPIQFYYDGDWREGTVRAISVPGLFGRTIRVDDGDFGNDDLRTNGFRVAEWAYPRNVRRCRP